MEPIDPKTPISQDKRLFLAVGTVIALLVSRYLGITLDPALLATIAATVIGYITNSAIKEASIAKSNAAGAAASAAVVTDADAAKALAAP